MYSESAAPSPAPTPQIAVVGTGSIGRRHLQVLGGDLSLVPVAVPIRAARIDELRAEGYEVAASLPDAVGDGDLVIVCSDTGRHLEFIRQALRLGCHVLSEKPLAPTVAGLRETSDLAAAANRQVYVGCVLRFDPGLRCFRECLPQIGPVFAARIECQSYLPDWVPGRDYRNTYSARSSEGGVLRDLIHEIDYALWLYGRPSSVSSTLANTGQLGIDAEESADLLWKNDNETTVSIRLDYLSRIPRRRMRAFGVLGELEWDSIAGTVTLSAPRSEPKQWIFNAPRNQAFASQASAFLRAASGTGTGDLATFEEGAFAVALCDAARKSSSTRREEQIPDWRNS